MEKIWSSHQEIMSEDKYVRQYMGYARERAYKYIKDVVTAVGSISTIISGKPVIITRFNDNVVVHYGIGAKDKTTLDKLEYDVLIELCQGVHDAHLVTEYGEDEES